LLFNFPLEYAIRRVQVNQEILKLNGTHQLLVYANDINILGRSIHTIKKNIESFVVASKQTGIEVIADKTVYLAVSQDQKAVENHNRKTDNKSFERVKQFRYFKTTLMY